MNDDTSDRRRWAGLRHAGAACVASIALLAAACGGGGSPVPSASSPGLSAATAQALVYAKCMRSHGIPDFPDPNAHDSTALFSLGGINSHSAQYQSANKTCQKKTGFGHFSSAQLQQGMNAMLKYAGCMRSHGITNFPDPFENSQQMGFNITGIDMNSPQFTAAQKTCQPLWPGGGP
jgi:hypothetical protein